jgi:competence protein ComEA
MLNRAFLQVPPAPVVLAAAIFLAALLGRGASVTEDRPFFLPSEENSVHVQLSGPGLSSGVYQLNDGLSLLDVINLTGLFSGHLSPPAVAHFKPAINGANYVIAKKDQKIKIVQRGWMPASQRIALGIPLHPDRMSISDWAALPGIGAKLADRINMDRQKNGEFGSLNALQRVKGIGPGKITSWKDFF